MCVGVRERECVCVSVFERVREIVSVCLKECFAVVNM